MKVQNQDGKESRSWAGRMAGGVEGHVQGRVVAGLLQLVPLIVTIIVILFIVNKADSYVRALPFVEGEPWDVTGIGLAALVVAFYLIGLLTLFRFGRWIVNFIGEVLLRVPVVKVVYRLMLQVTNVVASDYGFSRVVFVEWPREGMIAMGFVTGRVLSKDRGHSLVTVYIPTVPNPTSGNMAFVHEDDVMETDLSVDSAMKLVFSGGFVIPDSMAIARVPRKGAGVDAEFLGAFQAEKVTKPDKSRETGTSSDTDVGTPAVGGYLPRKAEEEKPS